MKKVLSLALLVAVGAFIVFMAGCDEVILDPPTGLQAEGTTDELGIKLTWSPVTDAESYNVYFDGELLMDEVTVTEYSHAEPGKVGEYTVTSVAGNDESPDSDPLSTAPLTAVIMSVDELNGDQASGIGWSELSKDGTIQSYSMATAENKAHIYFYYTDFDVTDDGEYELAVAAMIEQDPGAPSGMGTGWHTGGVTTQLADAFGDVAQVPITGYETFNMPTENATQAVWIQVEGGGYYGLIETTNIDKNLAQVDIKITFQPVKNFALFK